MARLPELITYARQHGLKLISIADLISYRLRHERLVSREAIAALPSQFGDFQVYAYRHQLDNSEHVALVKGDPETFEDEPVMVRMHAECLTGDALGSLRCDCRMQLQAALKMIEYAGKGVVVYLRQEGRGIGLVNKLRAYSLQDQGFDTVEANERLGLPVDQRNYGMGAQMLMDIGVRQFRLITNNPRKIAGLKGYGLEMVDRVPLLIEATVHNADYLATKAEKLGHLMLRTYLATVALHWRGAPSSAQRYERLEQLRQLARAGGLLLQEEARSVAIALFEQPPLIFNLGLAQADGISADWYQAPPAASTDYLTSLQKLLTAITIWPEIEELDFLISNGSDPFTTLQVRLERQPFEWDSVSIDDIFDQLDTQRLYTLSKHRSS